MWNRGGRGQVGQTVSPELFQQLWRDSITRIDARRRPPRRVDRAIGAGGCDLDRLRRHYEKREYVESCWIWIAR